MHVASTTLKPYSAASCTLVYLTLRSAHGSVKEEAVRIFGKKYHLEADRVWREVDGWVGGGSSRQRGRDRMPADDDNPPPRGLHVNRLA